MASAGPSNGSKSTKGDDDPKPKKSLKDLFKQVTFEISLQYNRMRYPTWNEVLLPNNLTTGVILGQLPDANILNRLIQKHGVTSVVSCVEQFELDKFNLNFTARHVAQLTLPQEDFSRMDPRMLEDGAAFLMEHLNVTNGSLCAPQLGPRAYVHCKAGRGRSTAVAVAYMLNLGFKIDVPACCMDKRLNILACYDYALRCRGHISCSARKLEDVHAYYLRVRARRGILLSLCDKNRDDWIKNASACCLKAIKTVKDFHKTEAKLKERISKDLGKKGMSLGAFSAQQNLTNKRDQLAKICKRNKADYERMLSDKYFHYANKVEKWLTKFYDRYNRRKILEVYKLATKYEPILPTMFAILRKNYPDAENELTDEILRSLSTADKKDSDFKNHLSASAGASASASASASANASASASAGASASTSVGARASTTSAVAANSLLIEPTPKDFKLYNDNAVYDWTDKCGGSVSTFQKLYYAGKLDPLPTYVLVRSTTISNERGMDVYFKISSARSNE